MRPATDRDPTIAVVGLGYVGLPLAVALAPHFDVLGYDIAPARVAELAAGHDRTGEVPQAALAGARVRFTTDAVAITGRDLYIVTVPTPVDAENHPDLRALLGACETVGRALRPGAVVAFESTVYPGVTERICGPAITRASDLACGDGFFLGYSPERINPGDPAHGLQHIVKVVAGQTEAVTEVLAYVYGRVTRAGVFRARDIRTAEAAKVIENAQRDINIAFINEVALIFGAMGLDMHAVLETAGTKWNFLDFRPGLVGGHCIGVDPYYLAHAAEEVGHHPEVILAGRRINDAMGERVAAAVAERITADAPRILVLGLTFKENVPDIRNSRVFDIVETLRRRGAHVDAHDPVASPAAVRREHGLEMLESIESARGYDAVIGAVQHDAYRRFSADNLARLVTADGLVADVKGMWRGLTLPTRLRRWQL